MATLQNDLVSPPTAADESLQDFAAIIQRNLQDLFELAHEHNVKIAFPGATDGRASDIVSVDDGTNVYLLVKTSRGWFRSAALTAL